MKKIIKHYPMTDRLIVIREYCSRTYSSMQIIKWTKRDKTSNKARFVRNILGTFITKPTTEDFDFVEPNRSKNLKRVCSLFLELFVLFRLVIILSVLWIMVSDFPVGIFYLFLTYIPDISVNYSFNRFIPIMQIMLILIDKIR
jgi:hypothetical protein